MNRIRYPHYRGLVLWFQVLFTLILAVTVSTVVMAPEAWTTGITMTGAAAIVVLVLSLKILLHRPQDQKRFRVELLASELSLLPAACMVAFLWYRLFRAVWW